MKKIKEFDRPDVYKTAIEAIEGRGWFDKTVWRSNATVLVEVDAEDNYISHRVVPFAPPQAPDSNSTPLAKVDKPAPPQKKEPKARAVQNKRIMPFVFTKEEEAKIIDLFNAGHAITDIGLHIRRNVYNVKEYCDRYVRSTNRILTAAETAKIQSLFDSSVVKPRFIAKCAKIPLYLVKEAVTTILLRIGLSVGLTAKEIEILERRKDGAYSIAKLVETSGADADKIKIYLRLTTAKREQK